MKLHRPKGSSDWANIKPKKWNRWQVVAAQTHGYVTIGNAITLIGLLLIIAGAVAVINKAYAWGLILFTIGRACDLLDGWAAEITKTKSYVGAFVDVTADKLEGLLVLIVLPIATVVPWWVAIAILALQSYISLVSILVLRHKVPIFPALSGKWGMAATWAGILSYVGAVLFDGIPGALFRLLGLCLIVVALSLSGYAASLYTRQYIGLQTK